MGSGYTNDPVHAKLFDSADPRVQDLDSANPVPVAQVLKELEETAWAQTQGTQMVNEAGQERADLFRARIHSYQDSPVPPGKADTSYAAGTRVLWRMGGDGPLVPAVIVHVHNDGGCSVAARHGGALVCDDAVPVTHLSSAPRTAADVLAPPEPGDELQWMDGTLWRVARLEEVPPGRVWFDSTLRAVYTRMPSRSDDLFKAIPHAPGPLL